MASKFSELLLDEPLDEELANDEALLMAALMLVAVLLLAGLLLDDVGGGYISTANKCNAGSHSPSSSLDSRGAAAYFLVSSRKDLNGGFILASYSNFTYNKTCPRRSSPRALITG